uniref:Major facilitator superfamily (MFS) profile domain-containing protein n=1 Tax=Periophthalmus magnuspinnatus TaxID=409849 RepID=A0A3B4AP15_9GOBI
MFCCVFCCLFCCVFFCLFCCVFCCVLCCLFCCVFCCMFSVCCCRIGGERVLLMSAASWGVITAGTPLMARLCSRTLFLMTTARFLMGLLQGVFFPSLASLCSHRVVKAERGFLMSILHSGTYLGTLVAGGLGSVMLQSYGWEYLFYCIGFSSGLWFCFPGREIPKQKHVENGRPHSKTRWLSFIKKPPVWSMMIAHTCAASTFYTLLSWLPTYFEESFPNCVSVSQGGVYNTVPWIAAIPASLVGGWVSDFLITKGYRVVYVRKLMQVVAMGIPVLFILPMSNAVNDLAPSCAGALYGFMNMMGALTGVVTVSLSGYLIEVTQTWATVFSLVALINSSGLGVYLVFGDAQRLDQGSPVTII